MGKLPFTGGENHRPLHQEVKSFNNESNDGKIKISVCCVFNNSSICQKLGINLIRVAILVIFVWIGGLKFWNYEAEGIVPFVANSPFMSSFIPRTLLNIKNIS